MATLSISFVDNVLKKVLQYYEAETKINSNKIDGNSSPVAHGLVEGYVIELPAIPSAGVYYFNTDKGIRYEVRIARMEDYVRSVINFCVTNSELEDEYLETNSGEQYRVAATIVNIVRIHMKRHPLVSTYTFTGICKGKETKQNTSRLSQRINWYQRYLHLIWSPDSWEYDFSGGNKVLVNRIHV